MLSKAVEALCSVETTVFRGDELEKLNELLTERRGLFRKSRRDPKLFVLHVLRGELDDFERRVLEENRWVEERVRRALDDTIARIARTFTEHGFELEIGEIRGEDQGIKIVAVLRDVTVKGRNPRLEIEVEVGHAEKEIHTYVDVATRETRREERGGRIFLYVASAELEHIAACRQTPLTKALSFLST